MRSKRARRFWVCLAAAGAVTTATASSWAWKPYTHVYLAQQAWQDAVDDGMITFHKVDKSTGRFVMSGGKPVVLGTYKVHDRIRTALQNSPAKFFAGVLGPDAYPDILTGQMRIHPPGADANGIPDADKGGPGTDAWLQQLWMKAWETNSDDAIAFATGYLSHAAGDIYAHTFMNTFAGGIFDVQDMSTLNWFKHITVEGYVAERTPDLAFIPRKRAMGISIFDIVKADGIKDLEGFIAENTWDIRGPGGMQIFPNEGGKSVSVPYHLGTLRETATRVKADMVAYDSKVFGDLSQAAFNASPAGLAAELTWACAPPPSSRTPPATCPDAAYGTADCPPEYIHGPAACAGLALGGIGVWAVSWSTIAASLLAYYSVENPLAMIIEGWTDNAIQTTPVAMKDWVTASHTAAIQLFFSPDHLAHLDADVFSAAYAPFKIDMESLVTGIDRGTVQTVNDILEFISTPVDFLKNAVGDAEKWIAQQVFLSMFHMTTDQAKECFAKPHMWLNGLLKNNPRGMGASLASMNAIMRLAPVVPATCTAPTSMCTFSPNIGGADPTGACDLFTGAPTQRFSVRPEDPQGVFPAAYNAMNMIKLTLLEPAAVTQLARDVARTGSSPQLAILGDGVTPTNAPQNAMLGFVASIDGSNEWMARRHHTGWGSQPMILAQDCDAYRSVFLEQRPDFDALGRATTGPNPILLDAAFRAWEPDPMAACGAPPGPIKRWPKLDVRLTAGKVEGTSHVTASEPSTFALGSTGKTAFRSPLARGALVVTPDGLGAEYTPPRWAPHGADQIVVTSKDGMRRAVVPIVLGTPASAGFRREVSKTAKTTDLAFVRPGAAVQLVSPGALPMTWSVVDGGGSIGDTKLEATHTATLAKHNATAAASEQQLSVHSPKLADVTCKGGCQLQAVEGARTATRARATARLGAAQAKRDLDTARATYKAPDGLTRDQVVTLRGVDGEGHTTTMKLRVAAPPPPLVAKVPAVVPPGTSIRLEVDAGLPAVGGHAAPPLPMVWTLVSGPGTLGDPSHAERQQHAAQKQAYLSGLEPLSKTMIHARPFEQAATRRALVDYLNANVSKMGPAFHKLAEIDSTYRAPAKVMGKQRVMIRGTAQDGTGRTVDVSFLVEP